MVDRPGTTPKGSAVDAQDRAPTEAQEWVTISRLEGCRRRLLGAARTFGRLETQPTIVSDVDALRAKADLFKAALSYGEALLKEEAMRVARDDEPN
jgi:hypothetical protein